MGSPTLLTVSLLVAASPALAHTRLVEPVPRSASSGLKVGPCGNVQPGAPTVFAPGETITVRWEETIDHPGWYRIAFSPGGDLGFDENVLADDLLDGAGPAFYSTEVTLPATPCEGCTLQIIQVMTDRSPPTLYFSCADLALREVGGGGGASGSGGIGGAAGSGGIGGAAGSGGIGGAAGSGGIGGTGGRGGGGAGSGAGGAGGSLDGGAGAGTGGATGGEHGAGGGCGCSASGDAPAGLLLLAGAGLLRWRRRRDSARDGSAPGDAVSCRA